MKIFENCIEKSLELTVVDEVDVFVHVVNITARPPFADRQARRGSLMNRNSARIGELYYNRLPRPLKNVLAKTRSSVIQRINVRSDLQGILP